MLARVRELLSRVAGAIGRGGGVDEDIREHLRLLTEDYRRRGLGPEEAARAARLAFGNPAVVREAWRDQRGLPFVDTVTQDLRYAARLLVRAPAFTAAAVLTLAIGIGLNTTIFTALNAVAFRPLPVKDGDRLVRVERWLASEGRGDIQYAFSEAEFRYLGAQPGGLADLIAAGWPNRVDEASGERPRVQFVSDNYFTVLGVVPAIGGTFAAAPAAADRGVVLSHPYWMRRYQGDPGLAGRTMSLNGATFTIAGVAPSSFVGTANPPQVPDVRAPISDEARMGVPRSMTRRFQLLGHLPEGLTRAATEAQIDALAGPLAGTFPAEDATTALTLERASYFGETNDPRFRAFAAALMAVVALVLLIACTNLANMLLARGTGRQKEIGMRLALGASRGRIFRQLFTETVLLALAGGGAGLALSIWGTRLLWLLIAEGVWMFAHGEVAPLVDLMPDARIFLFTLGVSLVAAVAFGVLPAVRLSRSDPSAALKDERALFGMRLAGARTRRWFVGAQVAISMTLLLAAGLLLRGLGASRVASTGYDTAHVFDVGYSAGDDSAQAVALQTRLVAALTGSAGLSVALSDRLPLAGTWTPPMTADGPSGRVAARTLANRVSPEYFDTLGIAIVRGRGFRRDETAAAVAIVSERTARLFWPGQDPLGRSFTLDTNFRGRLETFEVVGVARDVRTASLSRIDPAFVYLPLKPTGGESVLVRAAMPPRDAVQTIRQVFRGVDPRLLTNLQVGSLEDGPLHLWRTMIDTLAAFAGSLALLALSLAMGGIYGVVSYLASIRHHEIGVRLALGARRADVLRLVSADALAPVAVGAAIGMACALALSAVLRASLSFPGTPDVLFGVSAFDVATFAGVSALLAFIAAIASAGPVWRATRVDPVIALRQP